MERELVRVLSRLFAGASADRAATVGIGDDAAVIRGRRTRGKLVWTVDASVEGVHFDRRFLSLEDVGARSFEAAASDLAAMGARPVAALSSIIVPRALASRDVPRLARGQAKAAARLGCPIVGGNLARGSDLSITTSVLGVADRPLTRSGARPGDELWLVGDVGLAAAGFHSLERGHAKSRASAETRRAVARCIAAWREPEARIREGRSLARSARAAIDVSDGLGEDAGHLAEASAVRVVVEERSVRRLLRPELVVVARMLAADPLELALAGGEDYALLATGPSRRRPRGAKAIGRVEKGRPAALVEDEDGRVRPAPTGFDHFE